MLGLKQQRFIEGEVFRHAVQNGVEKKHVNRRFETRRSGED
jgi:hypothetical protein